MQVSGHSLKGMVLSLMDKEVKTVQRQFLFQFSSIDYSLIPLEKKKKGGEGVEDVQNFRFRSGYERWKNMLKFGGLRRFFERQRGT